MKKGEFILPALPPRRHCEGAARSNPGTGDDPDCFTAFAMTERRTPLANDGGGGVKYN
ncbi:MAG: hypothetical protein LBJ47_02840 [Tannerella sp.]|nr:hypothetical protein [Tannerella sp.]